MFFSAEDACGSYSEDAFTPFLGSGTSSICTGNANNLLFTHCPCQLVYVSKILVPIPHHTLQYPCSYKGTVEIPKILSGA